MTQDTRKDPRAKIVSLNVRYKSATVDEFIENHSYDVSKGGIFIKTPSPFPPGTLLKFEIRIAGDKAVISGVGRVVWKREAGQSTTERPSGMGVKFIKLDDSSRAVIDKLIEAKGPDAGNAFEEGNTEAPPLKPPPPGVAAAGTPFDLAPSTKIQSAPAHAELAAPKGEPAGAIARKPAHTMIGVGQPAPKQASPTSPAAPQAPPAPAAGRPAAPPPPRRPAPEPPPRPAGGVAPAAKPAEPAAAKPAAAASSMFPKTDSLKEMPPTGEQTVMKQAAELLEEALRGAGGSMDEIGSNPLFDVAMKSAPPAGGGATPTPLPEPPKAEAKAGLDPDAAMRPTPLPPEAEPQPAVAAKPPASPEPAPVGVPKREPPRESARPKPVEPARPVARAFVEPAPAPAGGNKALMGFVALVAVGVIGYFAYTQLLDTGSPTPADSTNVATSSQTPPPPVSAAPTESTSPSAVAMPSASAASSATAPAASASGGAATSASGAPVTSASVAAPPPVKPPPVAPPPVKPPPVVPPPVAPPPVTAKPVVAPAPVAPKPVTPRPRKPADDDNPY